MGAKELVKREWDKVVHGADKKSVISIFYMTIALALYFYFGIHEFFESAFGKYFSSVEELLYYKYIYHNFMAFFFFFVLSVPVVKFINKQKFADVGLKYENNRFALIILLLSLIVGPLIALSSLADAQMTSLYPLGGTMIFKNASFFILYYISYTAYYFGWEYLFRGLGFFNINKKYGPLLAIAVTTLISSLVHSSIAGFGKPMTETLSAVFAGVIFGFIAYKSKSIYPTFALHLLLGVALDIFSHFII